MPRKTTQEQVDRAYARYSALIVKLHANDPEPKSRTELLAEEERNGKRTQETIVYYQAKLRSCQERIQFLKDPSLPDWRLIDIMYHRSHGTFRIDEYESSRTLDEWSEAMPEAAAEREKIEAAKTARQRRA